MLIEFSTVNFTTHLNVLLVINLNLKVHIFYTKLTVDLIFQGKEEKIYSTYANRRNLLRKTPSVELSDLIAARESKNHLFIIFVFQLG